MKKILFLCTHNSARSIMAEALFNHYFSDLGVAYSAGTEPKVVNPLTVEVLRELNIDTSKLHSKSVQNFIGEKFDIVVTVCDSAKETCPVFPGCAKKLHKSFEDPALSRDINKFRKVRDEILEWLRSEFRKEI